MPADALSRRYAKALLSIGLEDGNQEEYGRQLGAVSQAMAPSLEALSSPVLSREVKRSAIEEIARVAGLADACANLLKLLVDKGRLKALPTIVLAYFELSDRAAGRLRGTVRSAVPLTETQLSDLRAGLSKRLGLSVSLKTQVDADLLGGIRTQVGSLVIDGSLSGQLERFESQLRKG